jgi:rhamnogalacturonan hydrolase
MLIEQIYCNWSGGCAIGSLGTGTDISNIIYDKVYSVNSNQMMMIKSNGGDGTVKDCVFRNFIGHKNAYGLDLDAHWSSLTLQPGEGVEYRNLTFSNWRGSVSDGTRRAPVNVVCPDGKPCTGLRIEDLSLWTETGTKVLWKCGNAFGTGACLGKGSGNYAVSTVTVTATP